MEPKVSAPLFILDCSHVEFPLSWRIKRILVLCDIEGNKMHCVRRISRLHFLMLDQTQKPSSRTSKSRYWRIIIVLPLYDYTTNNKPGYIIDSEIKCIITSYKYAGFIVYASYFLLKNDAQIGIVFLTTGINKEKAKNLDFCMWAGKSFLGVSLFERPLFLVT